MSRITEELLRRRAEHNEGCLSTLREITLHQFDIAKIELVGDLCRHLEILYLQNNLIGKIENLHHLKELKYLSLAVNNIVRIENLEWCESLEKLDLTVNFIEDPLCLETLRENYNLKELFLIGNPCTKKEGFRLFAIHTLPQLKRLDGEPVSRTERLRARQEYLSIRQSFVKEARERGEEVSEELPKELPVKFDEDGNRVYGHSPADRWAAYRDMEETKKKDEKAKKLDASGVGEAERILERPKRTKKPVLSVEEELEKYGRIMQRNDAGWSFRFDDEPEKLVLRVMVGKYLDTSAINIDVHPMFIRVIVRNDLLQLTLDDEVVSDKAIAQRSTTTGELAITMPKARSRSIGGQMGGDEDSIPSEGESTVTSRKSQRKKGTPEPGTIDAVLEEVQKKTKNPPKKSDPVVIEKREDKMSLTDESLGASIPGGKKDDVGMDEAEEEIERLGDKDHTVGGDDDDDDDDVPPLE